MTAGYMSVRRPTEAQKQKPAELFSVRPELIQVLRFVFLGLKGRRPIVGAAKFFHLIYK